ncbi:MAG: signal peptidase I [Chloroflexi bacterium]|nr:signal peptidase I [Chloroflexota bacterium]
MAEFDDNEGAGSGWMRRDEETPRSFDPLFDPWDEREDELSSRAHDDLFDFAPVEATEEEAEWGWAYRPAGDGYPDRHRVPYEERLTELQRRLRTDTIVLPRPERRWAVTARELAETLLLALLIFFAVRASFQNFKVEGASMEPSLENGEYVIVNKLSYAQLDSGFLDWLPFVGGGSDGPEYLWGSPDRGDVIVFAAPTSTSRDFIKRIIGVPGDEVLINETNGEVSINTVVLFEPYIQGTTACGSACRFDIPLAGSQESFDTCGSSECYFVMGDNRQNSSDSRQGWLVPRENIIGKTLITYWNDGGPEISLAPNHSVGEAEEARD